MKREPQNRLRILREAAGLSQQDLAQAVGLSRQSVLAIESGRHSPSVDLALRLSALLGCTVEDIFATAAPEHLLAEPVGATPSGRVALARLHGKWLSYPLRGEDAMRSADGIAIRAKGDRVEIEPLREARLAQENVVLMGCAQALGLLADRLNSRAGAGRFLWFSRSSTDSLRLLGSGQTHLAGVHLTDEKTGEDNLPDVRRHLRRKQIAMITLARWEVGLLTAKGNPRRIRSLAEVSRYRLVLREQGSGARRLLTRELAKHGQLGAISDITSLVAHGHLAVASAISLGAADVGIASRDAALAFGLHFQPLAEERYDLVLPRTLLGDARMERMMELLHTTAFQRELSALGYDVRQCGQRIAEGVTS